MKIFYIHYSGYCLFSVSEFEEIGHLIKSVRSALSDIKKFSGFVKLINFMPLNVNEAHECCSNINENKIPQTLIKFIIKCDLQGDSIGSEFSNLSEEFKEKFNVNVITNVRVMEIIRWIRFHIVKKLKKFTNADNEKTFLKSLSHKNVENNTTITASGINVTNSYNLIINLEKNLNTKLQNLKSLIQPFLPEFVRMFDSLDISFARFLSIYLNEEITDKSAVINEIFDCKNVKDLQIAINTVYGKELIQSDKCFIKSTSDEIINFYNEIQQCKTTTLNITKETAPNLSCLLERTIANECDLTAAKLITKAGSLKKLSELASSTIHTLTFQDAMLRKGKFASDIPRSAKDKLHSRESKILSDKVALASRMDYFSSRESNAERGEFGKQLKSRFDTDLKVWADGKGLKIDETSKIDVQVRIQRLKLKRKEKKKNWLKRKNSQKSQSNSDMAPES